MSQANQILRILKRGRKLTPAYAFTALGIYRLAPRILELRRAGHPISTEMIERGGHRYAQYCLSR